MKKYDDSDCGHPSTDNSDRFSNDQLLRAHGFRIFSRKNNSSAIWAKNHKQFTEKAALKLIKKKMKEVTSEEYYEEEKQ
jgi:hypothetical protein